LSFGASIQYVKEQRIFSNAPAILSQKEEEVKVATTSKRFLKEGRFSALFYKIKKILHYNRHMIL
jgi:hypothetical protein